MVRTLIRDAFFTRISECVHRDPGIDPEQVSRSVFSLLVKRLPAAEIEEIRAASPGERPARRHRSSGAIVGCLRDRMRSRCFEKSLTKQREKGIRSDDLAEEEKLKSNIL